MNFSRKSKIPTALICLTVFIPSVCFAWSGKVVSVTDGDTIKVLHEGKQEKIRLYGIDAPEKGQGYGNKAQKYLSSFVSGETVEIERKATDRYGRTVGLVSIVGQNINALIVQTGHAWVFRKYCNSNSLSS